MEFVGEPGVELLAGCLGRAKTESEENKQINIAAEKTEYLETNQKRVGVGVNLLVLMDYQFPSRPYLSILGLKCTRNCVKPQRKMGFLQLEV